MTQQRIAASQVEIQKLVERINAANQAKLAADHANAVAVDCFILFVEGKGIPSATFVGIENGEVIVAMPERETPKPELVA